MKRIKFKAGFTRDVDHARGLTPIYFLLASRSGRKARAVYTTVVNIQRGPNAVAEY
jgi:hypothetical protein